ncbi:MAG: DUF5799 family protein [Halovenus sp.]|uniref:DUF5799 family protein n=1 Tax=Halovenus amylolytica TaxID=2500550 RepID=UPI000FE30ED0
MTNGWRDQLAGARMQVDQQFNDRILGSEFSNQEWGLIMTAVEFDIQQPDDPDQAELVADTDKIAQVIPELDNLPQGMGGPPQRQSDSGGDGLFSGLKSALGLGGGSEGDNVDEQKLESATALVEEYTTELQTHLEQEGRWEMLCERASQS